MRFSFAPMEGVTGADYRRIHCRMFPGADVYYAPFVAPDADGRFKRSHLRALLPERNEGVPLIPQVLCSSPSAFLGAAQTLAELGYTEVNLNLGCPSGTVTAKRKGAGMLADPAALDALLDGIFARTPTAVSVKTRMGMDSTAEFPAILEVYNRYPIRELIVHARDRAGMYRSRPDWDGFAAAMESCCCPICYNGNLFTPEDLRALQERFPRLERVMLGRGAAANPALFRVLRGGPRPEREELRAFHDALLEAFLADGLAPPYALARMKELWFYMVCLFPDGEAYMKALKKSRDLPAYRAAAEALFTRAAFDPAAGFHG